MGYFSELAIDNPYHEDHSAPSPELQLKWRIEDLWNRFDEISTGKQRITTAHYLMGCSYSKDDLAFTPPELFSKGSDVMEAIAIAEERMASIEAEKADIREVEKNKSYTGVIPGQITFEDIPQAESEPCIHYKQVLKAAA